MRSHRPSQKRLVSWCAAMTAASVLMSLGCGDRFGQRVLSYAQPTAALESGDADLVRAVKEIEQELGLSCQLDAPRGDADTNTAAALSNAYSDELHLRLTVRVEELLASDAPDEERAEFLDGHEQLIEKTAAAIDLPNCRFDVGHKYGFFAAMGYLNDAALGSRLMLLRAQQRGNESAPEGLGDLLRSLRLAQELSQVQRVESRIQAATLREEALTIAGRFLAAGYLGRFEAEQLYGRLRDQLADWPSDRRMLIGERATVMHAYEAIHGGMLGQLLTVEEHERLKEDGQLERIRSASPETIHADESRYLQAISKLIEAADLPQSARIPAIEQAFGIVNLAPGLFAGPLFLQDLPEALRVASEDRARAEAWTLALAVAAELKPPPFRTSPLSGEEYVAERDLDRVVITFGDAAAQNVILPMLPR